MPARTLAERSGSLNTGDLLAGSGGDRAAHPRAHRARRQLVRQDRFSALIKVHAMCAEPVIAAAAFGDRDADAEIILTEIPIERALGFAAPGLIARQIEGGQAGVDGRRRFERLLIENGRAPIRPEEAFIANSAIE